MSAVPKTYEVERCLDYNLTGDEYIDAFKFQEMSKILKVFMEAYLKAHPEEELTGSRLRIGVGAFKVRQSVMRAYIRFYVREKESVQNEQDT